MAELKGILKKRPESPFPGPLRVKRVRFRLTEEKRHGKFVKKFDKVLGPVCEMKVKRVQVKKGGGGGKRELSSLLSSGDEKLEERPIGKRLTRTLTGRLPSPAPVKHRTPAKTSPELDAQVVPVVTKNAENGGRRDEEVAANEVDALPDEGAAKGGQKGTKSSGVLKTAKKVSKKEYEVEYLTGARVKALNPSKFKKTEELEYRVKWLGWKKKYNTFESEKNCQACPDLVKKFWIDTIKRGEALNAVDMNQFMNRKEPKPTSIPNYLKGMFPAAFKQTDADE